MSPSVLFLADLTVALTLAMLFGAAASRLRLNPIVGYLAAGVAIGPSTPGYVARFDTLETLATLGLIFLLFSIGLGFSFGEIKDSGPLTLAGNLLVMAAIAAVAAGGARLLAIPHPVTVGLITAVSSTAVGAALLRGWHSDTDPAGRFAVAQLVVQDLVAVALLVITSVPAEQLSFVEVSIAIAKTIGFVAVALVLGATALQRAVRLTLARASSETLFGVCTALALVAAWLGYLAGLGFEFGAFVAGAVISEAAGSAVVATVVAPLRALFVALFFVSIGMLLDMHALASHWPTIVGLGAAFTVVRFLAWGALARLAGIALGGAVLAGAAMTSMGEFNIVLANAAKGAHRITIEEAQLLLGIAFVTIFASVVFGPWLARFAPATPPPAIPVEGERNEEATVAVLGFGRVGQTVGWVLRHAGIAVTALDRDRDIVERARAQGFEVVVGEATDPAALERLIGPHAAIVVITIPESAHSGAIVERIAATTSVHIIVRAASVVDIAPLVERGASLALVPEAEGALVFAASVLRALGRAPAEIERELDAERYRSPMVAEPPADGGVRSASASERSQPASSADAS